MDTPFQWTKQVASHFGGTRNGLVISYPKRITDKGGLRSQFAHVTDITPTILEVTGVTFPDVLNGVKQKPLEGVSLGYSFANAQAPTRHPTQYFEMMGNRAIYHNGWMASTTPLRLPWMTYGASPSPDDFKWELYHVAELGAGERPRRPRAREVAGAAAGVRSGSEEVQRLSARFLVCGTRGPGHPPESHPGPP
jgi:arylsulfatase